MPDKWQRYINRYVNDIVTKAASILMQPLLFIEISIFLARQETGAILVDALADAAAKSSFLDDLDLSECRIELRYHDVAVGVGILAFLLVHVGNFASARRKNC